MISQKETGIMTEELKIVGYRLPDAVETSTRDNI